MKVDGQNYRTIWLDEDGVTVKVCEWFLCAQTLWLQGVLCGMRVGAVHAVFWSACFVQRVWLVSQCSTRVLQCQDGRRIRRLQSSETRVKKDAALHAQRTCVCG